MFTIRDAINEAARSVPNAADWNTFEERFVSICQEHRQMKRALAFAFVLYDTKHPDIIKLLRDNDYWRALDEEAGHFLTVFAFHSPSGATETGLAEMSNSVLGEFFPAEAGATYPSVLFFQVSFSDEKVIDAFVVPLKGKGTEECFHELRDVIKRAAASVRNVTEENIANDREIFGLIQSAFQNRTTFTILKQAWGLALFLQRVFKFFHLG